jgi:hypothetical protein
MASQASSTMLSLLATLVWTCISQPTLKNSLYKQLFHKQIILSEISSAASLCTSVPVSSKQSKPQLNHL